jgi:hypothetical protein
MAVKERATLLSADAAADTVTAAAVPSAPARTCRREIELRAGSAGSIVMML